MDEDTLVLIIIMIELNDIASLRLVSQNVIITRATVLVIKLPYRADPSTYTTPQRPGRSGLISFNIIFLPDTYLGLHMLMT